MQGDDFVSECIGEELVDVWIIAVSAAGKKQVATRQSISLTAKLAGRCDWLFTESAQCCPGIGFFSLSLFGQRRHDHGIATAKSPVGGKYAVLAIDWSVNRDNLYSSLPDSRLDGMKLFLGHFGIGLVIGMRVGV